MTAFSFFTKNEQKYNYYVVAQNLGRLLKSHGLHSWAEVMAEISQWKKTATYITFCILLVL